MHGSTHSTVAPQIFNTFCGRPIRERCMVRMSAALISASQCLRLSGNLGPRALLISKSGSLDRSTRRPRMLDPGNNAISLEICAKMKLCNHEAPLNVKISLEICVKIKLWDHETRLNVKMSLEICVKNEFHEICRFQK